MRTSKPPKPPTLQQVARALELRRRRLLRIPGVVGAAAGFRERKGSRRPEPVLTVFVEPGLKKRTPLRVSKHRRIPFRVRIKVSGRYVWVPVDLVESSPLGRLQNGPEVVSGLAAWNSRTPDNRGTLGWIARRASDGVTVICGSFHVLVRFDGPNVTGRVDKVYSPKGAALEDVTAEVRSRGQAPVIGFVLKGRRNNVVDAALVRVDAGELTARAKGIGPIGTRRDLTTSDLEFPIGPPVQASMGRGRVLKGNVTRYPADFPFRYPDFPNGLLLMDLIETDLPTVGGDSGALLLDMNIRPVGMLVGRSDDRSYFLHIANIADAFGLVST